MLAYRVGPDAHFSTHDEICHPVQHATDRWPILRATGSRELRLGEIAEERVSEVGEALEHLLAFFFRFLDEFVIGVKKEVEMPENLEEESLRGLMQTTLMSGRKDEVGIVKKRNNVSLHLLHEALCPKWPRVGQLPWRLLGNGQHEARHDCFDGCVGISAVAVQHRHGERARRS